MVRRRTVEVRVGYFEVSGDQRLEHDLGSGNARDGECSLRSAVVRHRPADHFVTRALARDLEVLLDELDGSLDRLTATGSEEHVVQVAGSKRRLQRHLKHNVGC